MSYLPTPPAASPPLTEDEAIDAAIAQANALGLKTPYLVELNAPYGVLAHGAWSFDHCSTTTHPLVKRPVAKYNQATGQYERTVPYASAKPKPGLKLTNPWQLPDPWQLPEQPPDTVRSPEPAPELKSCYYCQHPPGSHAPACIEVKYGHV